MSEFRPAFEHVLQWEGGYVDDPADSGGRTKFGISEAAHPEAWEDGPPSEADVLRIYREEYWSHPRIKAGKIENQWIATYLFDAAVNHGPENGAKMLQRAIRRSGGSCREDGWIGTNTRKAMRFLDPKLLMDRFVLMRVEFYRRIVERDGSQSRFLHGWLNRAMSVVNLW